ncbi:RagB/SusD family nutrient uptake outer membrane protein [Epilithonimonas xixisoli]|uniref:Putative outer membrane starch-binding protein n=1 Tax=Epilithonimonas xixisoli TaxID=1476462 RepID=A0A4R8I7W5_9FLAO|nr:RagB/SusD family nutrient uptake outer membrane protein [Epilithonimonas xixisoli]TDX84759.1 putative outer membrane starch-binding protein [Epilithonimonas xixisoli]
MKKYIIKIALCVGVLSVYSCKDALDIVQEGELYPENAYKYTDDLRRVLDANIYNGSYINSAEAEVASLSMFPQISFTSQFTDEVGIGPANSDITVGPHQFYVDITTSQANDIWVSSYNIINNVVRLIEGSKNITPTSPAEQKLYNSYLAEGRTLRAFAYLQLLSYYSTDMADPNALGVILLDHIPTFEEQLPRVNNSAIYSVIESDLDFAENNISLTGRNESRFFVSKQMINALKARYYLYTKKYTLAKQYAQKVVNESGLSLTSATPVPAPIPTSNSTPSAVLSWHRSLNVYTTSNPYVKMWQDTNPGEVIFALSRPNTDPPPPIRGWENMVNLFAQNSSTISGSRYDMGRNLFNILDSTPGDIRRWAYIDPTYKMDPNYLTSDNYRKDDALVIDKYPGRSGVILRNDVKVFRLSEIYFILAECAAVENNLTQAAQYIKAVRDARNYRGAAVMPTYTNSQSALIDILKERRVELAFEGHRYIDLKRLGKLTGQSIDRSIVDDYSKEAPVTIPNDDFRFTLPIPRKELQANQLIQQNPGYKATP